MRPGALAALGAALLAISPGCSAPGSGRRASAIALHDCQLSGADGLGRAQARCGVLQVPEDRARPDGPRIPIRVAVVPARGAADPTPVFFLAGGPGQAATEQHAAALAALSAAQRDREVVLVDQRGTGETSALRCEALRDAEDPEAMDARARASALDRCIGQLRGDPRHYTTLDFAADLDAVREALGYRQVHLLGVSYGTRAALAYLRAYPDRVRTAVLDGVAPPQVNVGEQMALTAQRALDLDVRRCQTTPACASRFPDLSAALGRVLDRLQRAPEHVQLRHPTTGAPAEVTLTRSRFASTVFLYTYVPELAGLLPLLIHTADARGDFAPVAAQSIYAFDDFQASISYPLQYSVLCAEDVPFYAEPPEVPGWLPSRSYLGDRFRASLREVCARWPHAEVARSFKEPVRSGVPVLLLSGEADPVTPPDLAEEARRTLPGSVHLVVKGHGHNVSPRGCLPALIAQVQRDSGVGGLDARCVADIGPAPIFLDFLGHEP